MFGVFGFRGSVKALSLEFGTAKFFMLMNNEKTKCRKFVNRKNVQLIWV